MRNNGTNNESYFLNSLASEDMSEISGWESRMLALKLGNNIE